MFKVTKINSVENPRVKTADSEKEYRDSLADENFSPNIDYWVIGDIIGELEVGKSMVMDRWIRNGKMIRGNFMTSAITELTENGFKTRNSIYLVEKVEDEVILDYPIG